MSDFEDDDMSYEEDWSSDDMMDSQGLQDEADDSIYGEENKVFETIFHTRSYTCQNAATIAENQKQVIDHVAGVTSLSPGFARILLTSYRWDDQKLLVEYSDDPAKICKSAGLPHPDQIQSAPTTVENAEGEATCSICFDDIPKSESASLSCGHTFCQDCWKGFLAIEVKEMKKMIQCPGVNGKTKCTMVLDELWSSGSCKTEKQRADT